MTEMRTVVKSTFEFDMGEGSTLVLLDAHAAVWLRKLIEERDALKHDVDRHQAIATSLATENEELRAAVAKAALYLPSDQQGYPKANVTFAGAPVEPDVDSDGISRRS